MAIKSVDLKKLNSKLKDNLYGEILILKDLHHPHIVALIDCQETTAHIHLVMEFCELGDLSYFIKKRDTLSRHEATREMVERYPNPAAGGLNEVVARHFLKQLASALEFLRDNNYIHRDVKPQNLLLDPSRRFYAKTNRAPSPHSAQERAKFPVIGVDSLPTLKIADFGFARSLPATSLAETLCGSPLYMAPEILRYEKYDAKADLWSVGAVLYEMMTGKPPFRASNHVELLRKIERTEDKIKFPDDPQTSDDMKNLIRGLLQRAPVERLGYQEFFASNVVMDDIPGLVGSDRPIEPPSQPRRDSVNQSPEITNVSSGNVPTVDGTMNRRNIASQPLNQVDSREPRTAHKLSEPTSQRRFSGTPPRGHGHKLEPSAPSTPETPDTRARRVHARRPSLVSHATAPPRADTTHPIGSRNTPPVMQRQSSRSTPPLTAVVSRDNLQQREHTAPRRDDRAAREAKYAREARERAAQDVAFERDYVVVEKRAVEVNAFADELAASPRIQGAAQTQADAARGTLVRRATLPQPAVTTSAVRALQLVTAKRPDQTHYRQRSYDRILRDSGTTTSAISKAITMAGGRLLNMGWSPPRVVGRGGPSPPAYSPFPAYPTNQGSIVMIGDGSKMPADEDARTLHVIEESATRSDVVYGFAEVKYKQLIPLAPSTAQGQASVPARAEVDTSTTDDDGLTVDAKVTLSEEALVLYVKALSLLARSMDIAGAWWARKNRGEVVDDSTSPRTHSNASSAAAVGNRVNNVVQWVRSRFNEVLEKAEFVRLTLVECQKQLPLDHPSHPSNHSSATNSLGMKNSADNVIVSPGVTAEKLMYDRAVEMSRQAAVNELVGDDLPGCEIAYVTAMRMLEAILENDDDSTPIKFGLEEKGSKASSLSENGSVNGVEAEDRKVVLKSKYLFFLGLPYIIEALAHSLITVVYGIRNRLASLRKKIIIRKRSSLVHAHPVKPTAMVAVISAPAIASTPPP